MIKINRKREVLLDGKKIGEVSKHETASRSYWHFELSDESLRNRTKDPAYQYGWRTFDQTAKGAVFQETSLI